MTGALSALNGLAQESRLAAFRLLVEAGPDGLAAGEIAARLGLAPATLSFHLAHLERAGLAIRRRRGRWIIYAANYARMQALLSYLSDNCCGGDPSACARPEADAADRARRGRSPAA